MKIGPQVSLAKPAPKIATFFFFFVGVEGSVPFSCGLLYHTETGRVCVKARTFSITITGSRKEDSLYWPHLSNATDICSIPVYSTVHTKKLDK